MYIIYNRHNIKDVLILSFSLLVKRKMESILFWKMLIELNFFKNSHRFYMFFSLKIEI